VNPLPDRSIGALIIELPYTILPNVDDFAHQTDHAYRE